jgi:hypothetical protein
MIQLRGVPPSALPVPVSGSVGAGAMRDGAPVSGVPTVGALGVRLVGSGDVASVALASGVFVVTAGVAVLATDVFVAAVVVTVLVAVSLVWARIAAEFTLIAAEAAMQARLPIRSVPHNRVRIWVLLCPRACHRHSEGCSHERRGAIARTGYEQANRDSVGALFYQLRRESVGRVFGLPIARARRVASLRYPPRMSARRASEQHR